jgi:hypothetical protein
MAPSPTESHEHDFQPSEAGQLTTAQLRKLVFYTGIVSRCECGFIRLEDSSTKRVYSRNASLVQV